MTTYKKWVPWSQTYPRFQKEDTYSTLLGLDQEQIVVLDTETTGLKKTDEITEISVVDYHTGSVLLNTFVKPKSLDETFDDSKASEVSQIKYENLIDAPSFDEVYHELLPILKGYTVGGWNIEYDSKMIMRSAFKYSIRVPQFKTLDAMKLFQAFIEFSDYHTLSEALELFGFTVPDDAHRSLADVNSTIKILQEMQKQVKEEKIGVTK